MVEGDWSADSGDKVMRKLFETVPQLDAAFASNDQMALGALGVLHQMGRRVPEEVAVVGFDNIPDSAYFYPPLTTVNQPLGDLGNLGIQ